MAIQDTMSVMDKIEQLSTLALAVDDICLLWLYGSRARGTERADSDYDLAIAFNDFTLSAMDKIIRPQLLVSQWQVALGLSDGAISIIDINQCPIYLAINVVNEGQVLVDKNTSRLMNEESRIYSMFEHLQIEQRLHG